MGKVESFDDDVRIVNPEMIFTDRDNPRRVFWNVYDNLSKDEFYVINYHGFGGIGKSRLCAYLNDCIRSGTHPETQKKIYSKSLILNFEDLKNNCDKINVLESLANKLENECGYKFPLFKYALYVYYRTQGYSNDSPEVKKLQDNVIAATAIDIFGLVPVVGGIGSVVLKGIDSFAASMREKVIKNSEIIKQLDHMSSEDISEEIIKFFMKELREQTLKEVAPVVIFLDTYEQLQNYVYQVASAKVSEEWLWSRVGIIRRIPNVIWVLAGQRKVDWGETDSFWRDESNIFYEEIGEIKEADRIKKMLMQIGITEEDIVDTIVEQTGGVPVHLALCKDTYFNLKMAGITPTIDDFNMGYTQLAKRFIGGLSSELKDIVDILACLETWTQDDIAEMNFSADAYEHVMELSFIKKEADRYHMHKSVQEIVYKTCSPIIRKKCLLYFEKMLEDASVTTAEKKDYILKKLKLQATSLENLQAEEQEEAGKAFAREVLQYIEEYLSDYNFFSNLNNLLRGGVGIQYVDVISSKKLDIYSVYHSTKNGEYAVVRNYIKSGKIYDNAGLDDKTKGLLFVSLGKHEITNKNNGSARGYLLQAYAMLKDRGDLDIILDILSSLDSVCIKLENNVEADYICDTALKLIAKERMNTQLIHHKCNFLISKARCCRADRRYNDAITWVKQAEEVLKEYEGLVDLENDSFVRRYIIIFYEYILYYQSKGNQEQADKYAKLILDYAIKAYELNSSATNYRNLAISYRETAERTKDIKLQEEYFDKSIAILRELYEECPTQIRLDELFQYNRIALGYFDEEGCKKYISACEDILANEKRFQVLWKERFLYYRSLFSNYRKHEDWDKAEEKLTELDQMLEEQRGRLSEDKYHDYLRWNYKERGFINYFKGKVYETLKIWYKLYRLEKVFYEKTPDIVIKKRFANVCELLAYAYEDCGMLEKDIFYLEKAKALYGEVLEERMNQDTLSTYSKVIRWLNDAYKKIGRHQQALENCNIVLEYHQKLYETSKQEELLCTMADFLMKRGKMMIRLGQAEQVLADYQAFLALVEKKEYLPEGDSISTALLEKVDLMQCLMACLLMQFDKDLEVARAYLMASKCPSEAFEQRDRAYYLEKVESRIVSGMIERTYLTQEEGRAYLEEEES
ncbi:MAG: hypothetical protein IJX63_15025 [Lachnospiraceae bacterium]|nr:hypothetical protein [Lachnospiraceae bacterium]